MCTKTTKGQVFITKNTTRLLGCGHVLYALLFFRPLTLKSESETIIFKGGCETLTRFRTNRKPRTTPFSLIVTAQQQIYVKRIPPVLYFSRKKCQSTAHSKVDHENRNSISFEKQRYFFKGRVVPLRERERERKKN